ncbi:hypothetical protein XA68_11559 [Ophiocordyceps unilateralis]|uniref:GP-PDE domain-containing protein n=1 Tax=Ophiocordyceps unilateralis TaxID=268505 RepID=A0A2A9NX05_OPHUN|nr:hypothetical protein XA68_11559 [Ophiocordyceps unilateralis]
MWILLDIKMDDDAELLVSAIARAVQEVPSGSVPWEKRMVLGCWNASTLLAARRHLPNYALSHIGTSASYAAHFLGPQPNLALNLAYTAVPFAPFSSSSSSSSLPPPRRLRPSSSPPLFAWTVNGESTMRWALAHGNIDAVVTDDPAAFRALCRRWEDEVAGRALPPLRLPLLRSLALRWDWCCVRLRHRLVFLYRRFWLRKLDYLSS